jgi:cell division protein FtsX
VIVNTIRIAVHARRDEIEIMQLVGATDRLVAAPFVLEGMLVGVFGALLALLVLVTASGPVTTALVQFLDILPVSLGPNFVGQLAAGVLGFALLIGAGGASISVRTHLAK